MKGTHLVIENPGYSLTTLDNYKHNIHCSIQDILTKFVSALTEYLSFITEKINMKNIDCYKYIIERGIETIMHVFSITFYFTKNIDLSFYHSQKAYYFYIEFIEQISDDNITFLQLSSRDATTFVYKKTIYEINNEYKKTMVELTPDEKIMLDYVDTYMYIYKNITHFYINHPEFSNATKTIYMTLCCNNLLTINNLDLNKSKIKKNQLDCIYLFTNLLAYKQIDINTFFTNSEEFARHFITKKKLLDDKIIKQNIYNYFNEDNFHQELDPDLEQIFIIG